MSVWDDESFACAGSEGDEASLQPRHTRGDQALYEQRQLLLVFREQVRHSSAEARRFCMRDDQPALHDAVGIQLALDADRVILEEDQICGEMQALIGDVQDLAARGGTISRHETAPRNRHTALSALGRHRSLRYSSSESTREESDWLLRGL